MLIKNFKRKLVCVSSLMGQTVRFEAGEEVEVPELLVEECLKAGLIPSDDFRQAVREAAIEEELALAEEDVDLQVSEANAARIRANAMADASAEADIEAATEAAEAKAAKKRSESAKKAAATRAANNLNAQ